MAADDHFVGCFYGLSLARHVRQYRKFAPTPRGTASFDTKHISILVLFTSEGKYASTRQPICTAQLRSTLRSSFDDGLND